MTGKLDLDPALVARARELARRAGQPVVDLARSHTTVSVERAVLRLAGVTGADPDGIPWVNRLVDAVVADTGLGHGVTLPVFDALAREQITDVTLLAQKAAAGSVRFQQPTGKAATAARRAARKAVAAGVRQIDRRRAERDRLVKRYGDPQQRPWIYLIVATGDIYEDIPQAQAAARAGADIIAVIRSTGQSLLDYVPEGATGHAEIRFTGVRVPAENIIAGEGLGFAISQARLGPGRIHHCMRLIGMAERGLALMCRRTQSRVAFGRPLAEQGVIRDWIAESRVRIEQARLLVLKTAWLMDTVGNKGAHTEIQAIKIVVPQMTEWVLDKAIQAHGGGGVSQDFVLAELWAGTRTLRLADGPDEVHRNSLAKAELRRTAGEG